MKRNLEWGGTEHGGPGTDAEFEAQRSVQTRTFRPIAVPQHGPPLSPKVLIAPYYKTWPLFSVNQMKTPGIVLSIYRVRLSVHLSLFSVSSEIIMLKHNSYFHRSDLYIFIHTSSQPLGGILWCGITVRGAARSAQYSTVHLPETSM